jgi:putative SOS response-associated peptidase YedK
MCGRYASTRSAADLMALFDAVDETDGELVPNYNVAPTDPAPIVRTSVRVDAPVLSVARWGLVPAWSSDATGAARMINARSETVASSRAFARSFAERRCLVPIDGWFEWRRLPDGKGKQPYFMTRPEALILGGIWSSWTNAEGIRLLTFSIVTLPAEGSLALVHNRMPLVLEPSRWEPWLSGATRREALLVASPQYCEEIEIRPVGAAIGDVRNDGPGLVAAVDAPPLSIVDQQGTLF